MNRTANWSESLELNIDKWIKERWEQFPNYIPMFCNVQNTNLGLVRHQASAGIGLVPQVTEGAPTPDTDYTKAYQTIYIPKSYRINVPVTWEEYEDDQYSIFQDRAGELADAGMRTANIYAASILMNSQSTSYTSYGDGNPLGSTSHERADGGANQSNASSTNIALSEPNIFTGIRTLRTQKNDAGQRFMVAENKIRLTIPGALEKLAQEVIRSDGKSGGFTNDLNYYEGVMANALILPWIGSGDQALFTGSDTRFMLTPESSGMGVRNFLTFLWRQQPQYSTWIDDRTKSYNMDVFMRFAYGWSHWLGTWITAGTGTGSYTD